MRIQTMLTAVLCIMIVSCGEKQAAGEAQLQTPKALEEKNASYGYPRGYDDDLIAKLYEELVSKDPELKSLEEKINALNKSKRDSMAAFDQFNRKNYAYFTAANNHVAAIKDSVLRQKMKILVAKQLGTYNALVSKHNAFMRVIDSNQARIADMQAMLKIVRTLPLIDRYQQQNLPGTTPFIGYTRQQQEVMKLADSVLRK